MTRKFHWGTDLMDGVYRTDFMGPPIKMKTVEVKVEKEMSDQKNIYDTHVTAEYDQIPICELQDTHLLNIIKKLCDGIVASKATIEARYQPDALRSAASDFNPENLVEAAKKTIKKNLGLINVYLAEAILRTTPIGNGDYSVANRAMVLWRNAIGRTEKDGAIHPALEKPVETRVLSTAGHKSGLTLPDDDQPRDSKGNAAFDLPEEYGYPDPMDYGDKS